VSPRDVLEHLIELAEIRREQWQTVLDGSVADAVNELYEADEQEAAERVEWLGELIDAARLIEPPAWPKVFQDSSAIRAVNYAGDSLVLTVKFRSGVTWEYYGVTDSVAFELAGAESVGRYFHANIKGRYEGAKIEEVTPLPGRRNRRENRRRRA
jgi:KTSC domain